MSGLREAFRTALVERFGVEIPCDLDPEWTEEIALAWVAGRLEAAREDVAEAIMNESQVAPGFGYDDLDSIEDRRRGSRDLSDAALDVIRQALGKGAGA